jgi:signal transduction histidine kinase
MITSLLETAFNCSTNAIVIVHSTGKIRYCNQKFSAICLQNIDAILNSDVNNFLLIDTILISNIITENIKNYQSKIIIITKQGNQLAMQAIIHTIINDNENFVFFELLPNEKNMQLFELNSHILNTFISYLPDAFYVKDVNGRKLIANEVDLALMGSKKLHEVINKTDEEIFNNEVGKKGLQDDLQIIQTGQALINKLQSFTDENNNEKWLLTTKVPFYNTEGKIAGLIGLGRDITLQKNEEKKLIASEKLLLQTNADLQLKTQALINSNTDLERFAYVASHDLQEPLKLINGFMQLLKAKCSQLLDKEAAQYVDFSLDSATKMQQLIDDILAYSRATANQIEIQTIQMNEVVTQALQHVQATIAEKKATIIVGTMPIIQGNYTILLQLMQNLISNGLKYQAPGNTPIIKIDAIALDNKWTFMVEDNGIGIAVEYQEKVFELFQRLQTTQKYKGSGIGLATCKKIIEKLGGKIWVEPATKGGSIFKFYLH